MSKQDDVVPGLRVHLHQQGPVWGFDGALILIGLKKRRQEDSGFGGVLKVGWKLFVSVDLFVIQLAFCYLRFRERAGLTDLCLFSFGQKNQS